MDVKEEKEVTIRQIVEEERRLIEDRFRKDMEALKKEKDKEMLVMAKDSTTNKT